MGKLRDVRSRLVLWFRKRRLETALLVATTIAVTLACQEGSLVDPPAPVTFAEVPALPNEPLAAASSDITMAEGGSSTHYLGFRAAR